GEYRANRRALAPRPVVRQGRGAPGARQGLSSAVVLRGIQEYRAIFSATKAAVETRAGANHLEASATPRAAVVSRSHPPVWDWLRRVCARPGRALLLLARVRESDARPQRKQGHFLHLLALRASITYCYFGLPLRFRCCFFLGRNSISWSRFSAQ